MNQLKFETSPYLKQHAGNPVNWFSYSPTVIKKAKSENKLIFLSIGYSSCHWCHVMAEESFEDKKVAEILNEHYISVKIDREERPDIDHIYQTIGQIMGIQGGWPLSVFLTPSNKPIYVGTYFPKHSNYGRIGFKVLLKKIISLYNSDPKKHENNGDQILNYLNNAFDREEQIGLSRINMIKEDSEMKSEIKNILIKFQNLFDEINGGFGNAPKFPNFSSYVFLLREINNIKQIDNILYNNLKRNIFYSLKKMAHGGIYDQIGGGFHRYSVDSAWEIPHFEKMLYDNAMALVAYSEAFLYYNDMEFKKILREIINWLQSQMLDPSGSFYSALDADSEHQEGIYYGWTYDELKSLIPEQHQEFFFKKYGISKNGNFEQNLNILNINTNPNPNLNLNPNPNSNLNPNPNLDPNLDGIKKNLLKIRRKRIPPNKDDKIIISWNALLLHGLYSSYRIFENEKFGETVIKLADNLFNFFKEKMINLSTGKIHRIFAQNQAKIPGNLDDYAYLIQSLLDRYSLLNIQEDYKLVKLLVDYVLDNFYDKTHKVFYYTDQFILDMKIRPIKDSDMPLPSPNAIMAENLLRFHYFFNCEENYNIANLLINNRFSAAQKHPSFSSSLLIAFQYLTHSFDELLIFINKNNFKYKKKITQIIDELYIPLLVKYFGEKIESISRFKDKKLLPDAPFTAYLCQNFTCSKPIKSLKKLKDQLSNFYFYHE